MGRLFFDVSDLLAYASRNARCSGVQRVEIAILSYMLQNNVDLTLTNTYGIAARQFVMHNINSPDRLLDELGKRYGRRFFSPWLNKLKSLLRRTAARALKSDALPQAGDVLFIPGAFWLDREIFRFYRDAAARGAKLVVLLHDVLPITRPQLVAKKSDRFFGPILQLPIHVLTGSQSTQREIPIAVARFPGARTPLSCTVVPFAHEFIGAERNQLPQAAIGRLKLLLKNNPFVLCVSTVEVRKNHLRLIEAWTRLRSIYGNALPQLVVAGKRGWEAKRAIALLDAANKRLEQGSDLEPIIFIECPNDEELRWLYASCKFTVFPSLGEGWGLPVGESLWFGKSCAVSQTTSLPEVGTDLCVYFDPESCASIEGAILRLLNSEVRFHYELRIKAARLRTWHETVRDLATCIIDQLRQQSAPASEVSTQSINADDQRAAHGIR